MFENSLKSVNGLTPQALFEKTKQKLDYYNNRKLKVVAVWECEIIEQLRNDSYFAERYLYWKTLGYVKRADIREAFFGGRTSNFSFKYELSEEERRNGDQLRYIDVCSLYPTVLKRFPYMIGEPVVINKDFKAVSEYFGFIKCKILPPKQLHYPVLPAKIDNKLKFPLCRKCVVELCELCTHSDEERCLISTWTTVDLIAAEKHGYIVQKIYEVIHYPTQSKELFSHYINNFLKIKTEASGWPASCDTEEKKSEFIKEFYDKEGVELDYCELSKPKNPGRRLLAKLMLNCLWGKLAQRSNLTQTKIVTNYQEILDLLTNPDVEISGEVMVDEDTLIVNYKLKNEEAVNPGMTSVAVSAFVTSYARNYLLNTILKLEEQEHNSVLYCDTDSIIYIERGNSNYTPSIGTFLGDWTDEITGEYGLEAKCVKFRSAGAKNYGYEVYVPNKDPITKIKTKGITLSKEAMEKINLAAIKLYTDDYIDDKRLKPLEVPQQQFLTDKYHNVYSRKFNKNYRVVFDKRVQVGNYTYPYGTVIHHPDSVKFLNNGN